jgi:hypothetical protein
MNPGNGSRGNLSVGGPNGIQIDGGNVRAGGSPMLGQGQGAPLLAPQPPLPIVSGDLAAAPALLVRHSGVVAATASVGAVLVFVGAAVMISALQLPWVLLVAPGALSTVLVAAGLAVVLRARKRVTTGGIDPEVERRILDVAVACRGRVTVTAAARALSMPMAEADATLSALARTGHVSVENDPTSGVVVYVFPDIDAGLVPVRRSP